MRDKAININSKDPYKVIKFSNDNNDHQQGVMRRENDNNEENNIINNSNLKLRANNNRNQQNLFLKKITINMKKRADLIFENMNSDSTESTSPINSQNISYFKYILGYSCCCKIYKKRFLNMEKQITRFLDINIFRDFLTKNYYKIKETEM